MITKPPLGLIPEYIYKESVQKWIDTQGGITLSDFYGFRYGRINAIDMAIKRYSKAGKPIPVNWIMERIKLEDDPF